MPWIQSFDWRVSAMMRIYGNALSNSLVGPSKKERKELIQAINCYTARYRHKAARATPTRQQIPGRFDIGTPLRLRDVPERGPLPAPSALKFSFNSRDSKFVEQRVCIGNTWKTNLQGRYWRSLWFCVMIKIIHQKRLASQFLLLGDTLMDGKWVLNTSETLSYTLINCTFSRTFLRLIVLRLVFWKMHKILCPKSSRDHTSSQPTSVGQTTTNNPWHSSSWPF